MNSPYADPQRKQTYTIRKSISGGWLIKIPCPLTGERQDAHISAICSIEHIHAVARSLTTNHVTSAQEVAHVAETRAHAARSIRADRARKASYRREVDETIDAGMLPTIGQLAKAGMLH